MQKTILMDTFDNMNLQYKLDYSMKKMTTFGTGGNATALVKVRNITELEYILTASKKENLPVYVFGNGSNILVSDKGLNGIVLVLSKDLASIKIKEKNIRVGGGFSLIKLSHMVMDVGLSGLEFAANIPGSVGGAVYMNAGAYNSSIFEKISEIVVWSNKEEKVKSYTPPFDYGYRYSFLQKSKEIILSVEFRLQKGEQKKIKASMEEWKQKRKLSQPIGKKCAGSIFKNPQGLKAYKIINDLGLQDEKRGDAEISKKHSNFIINKGKASSQDIYDLIKFVQQKVKEEKNIELECEIELLGEFE